MSTSPAEPDWVRYRDTITENPRGTIVPADVLQSDVSSRAQQLLHRLRSQGGPTSAQRFEIQDTLGVGGMGVVHAANQVVLGRSVAIKSLRPEQRTDDDVATLLREAWVAGSLDHPNVVPIHDITVDESGYPLIVLKRIEGESWDELMFDARRVRERFGADDLLEWNLGILMQVLNAIRFAHNRGIVHRDIKPENVMVGEFGEVYVVDWGIAVSLRDDGSGMLPLAQEATEMAGTPCYMAPEMLGGDDITELTDIYLVGAVLYEVLVGHPPHPGKDPTAVVTSIVESNPEFPDTVPQGLARICRRAMDVDPMGRFENAEQVRLAIQGFLQHRGSARLAVNAVRALEELEQSLTQHQSSGVEHRQELYRLYGACRFGFQEALSNWSGNQAARDGLHRATLVMVEYELRQGDARAADVLCAGLARPPDELRKRVNDALRAAAEQKKHFASLQELAHQLDMNVAQGVRFFTILVMGSFFTALPLILRWLFDLNILADHRSLMIWTSGCLLSSIGIGVVARQAMTASMINRRLYAMLLTVLFAQLVMEFGLWRAGFDDQHSVLMHEFMWSLTLAGISVTIDKRLAPTALCYLGVFFALAEHPGWELEAFTLPHFVLTANALYVWRPRGSDVEHAP